MTKNNIGNIVTKQAKLKKGLKYKKDFIVVCGQLYQILKTNYKQDYIIKLTKLKTLIDLLYTLIDEKNINQNDILYYINSSKIKYDFTKANYLHRLYITEEKERNNLIKKINISSVKVKNEEDLSSINLDSKLIKAIPPMLRYFPPEYGKGNLETVEGDEKRRKQGRKIHE